MKLCRQPRSPKGVSPTKPIPGLSISRVHGGLHRERRYHYPREALGVLYADFDVVLPPPLPRTVTSTTPGPDASELKMNSSPAQAIEAFDRLSDREKEKVLEYLRAAHPHHAVQVTEGEELQKLTMVVIILLFVFTFCFYLASTVTGLPTR
jgi:hypothetical protein